jgi:hypothetical protein
LGEEAGAPLVGLGLLEPFEKLDGEAGFAAAADAGDHAHGDRWLRHQDPVLELFEVGAASDEIGDALVGDQQVQLGADLFDLSLGGADEDQVGLRDAG